MAVPLGVVGAFVGPHLLLGGLVHLVMGGVAAWVSYGLGTGSRAASWAASVLSFVLVLLCGTASVRVILADRGDWGVLLVAVPLGLLFLVTLVTLLVRGGSCSASRFGGA